MKWTVDENGHYICGDYVMTRIKNAFNVKHSWWISKKNHINAFYCFSEINAEDTKRMLDNPETWIHHYETQNLTFTYGWRKRFG
jgi:hypothetical protein